MLTCLLMYFLMREGEGPEFAAILDAMMTDASFRATVRAMMLKLGPAFFVSPFERVMFAETLIKLLNERKTAEGMPMDPVRIQALTDVAFALSYEFTDEWRESAQFELDAALAAPASNASRKTGRA